MERKELGQEQLEKVTGGCLGTDGYDTGGKFTGFVDMYELHNTKNFNKEYYFISWKYVGFDWFKAKLTNSYEAWNFFGTNCTHNVIITDPGTASAYYIGKEVEISGNSHAVYTTKNFK